MSDMSVASYSKTQIGLHWSIAALILVQFLAHDGMEHVWRSDDHGASGDRIIPAIVLTRGEDVTRKRSGQDTSSEECERMGKCRASHVGAS